MKTVNDLIVELQSLSSELRQKPVVIIAENGLEMTPKPKLGLEEPFDFENIKNIVITYE
jgi:hypothetical protein